MVCRRVLRGLALVMALSAGVTNAIVHVLGDATFDAFVDSLPGKMLLLVDFYTPGCRACQRLSPVLDYLEAEWENEEPDESKRWFKLAKVDCAANPRLKSVFGVKKIPDLRFVRAGQWGTYGGGRLIEDLKEFRDRMALAPLPVVDAGGLLELTSTREAVFVLATETGADPISAAPGVMQAAMAKQHVATFCAAPREVLSALGLKTETFPALLKVVAGTQKQRGVLHPASYEGDVANASPWPVSRWVEEESFGLVSEFTPDNFTRLGSLGKLMVIGVVKPTDEATAAFTEVLETVAADLGLTHTDKLIFGTMDGVKLAGFAETFNIFEGLPRLVVLDMPRDTYYAVENLRLEVGEIEAFLVDVLSGGIPGQSSSVSSSRYVMKIWWMLQQGGAWSLLLLLPISAFFWVMCDTPQREEKREALRLANMREKESERLKKD